MRIVVNTFYALLNTIYRTLINFFEHRKVKQSESTRTWKSINFEVGSTLIFLFYELFMIGKTTVVVKNSRKTLELEFDGESLQSNFRKSFFEIIICEYCLGNKFSKSY